MTCRNAVHLSVYRARVAVYLLAIDNHLLLLPFVAAVKECLYRHRNTRFSSNPTATRTTTSTIGALNIITATSHQHDCTQTTSHSEPDNAQLQHRAASTATPPPPAAPTPPPAGLHHRQNVDDRRPASRQRGHSSSQLLGVTYEDDDVGQFGTTTMSRDVVVVDADRRRTRGPSNRKKWAERLTETAFTEFHTPPPPVDELSGSSRRTTTIADAAARDVKLTAVAVGMRVEGAAAARPVASGRSKSVALPGERVDGRPSRPVKSAADLTRCRALLADTDGGGKQIDVPADTEVSRRHCFSC